MNRRIRRRTFLSNSAALGVTAAATQVGTTAYASANGLDQAPADADPTKYVDVQLLSITDLHGYLQPTDVDGYNLVTDRGEQKVVGGAAYLAAHLKRLRSGRRLTGNLNYSSGQILYNGDHLIKSSHLL